MKVKHKNLSFLKKYEYVAAGIIVFLFIVFLTINLMIPNIAKVKEISKNKKILESKIVDLQKKNNTLSAINETLLTDNFIKLNYVVPENKDYALLFTTLDYLQQKLGIAITRTEFELGAVSTTSAQLKKNKKGDTFIVPLSLEVIGSIDQLQNFLVHLTDLSGRLITVDIIKMNIDNSGIVKAQLTGNTYFNPLPAKIGSVDSPIPEFSENYQVLFERILENQFPIEQIEEANQEVPTGKDNLFL